MKDPTRQQWNEQHKALNHALLKARDYPKAVDLFLSLHAQVHASEMSASGLFSFEDDIWAGISEEAAKRIPKNSEHSIAWVLWHSARIEDITMNYLIAGVPQILHREGWYERLNIAERSAGNDMTAAEIADLSTQIDVSALKAYRLAVGRRTREIVRGLPLSAFESSIEPARLERIRADSALRPATGWLLEYWAGKTVAGLLLMPPTRHNFVHLNEAEKIKAN